MIASERVAFRAKIERLEAENRALREALIERLLLAGFTDDEVAEFIAAATGGEE